jgi:hypothetical protein
MPDSLAAFIEHARSRGMDHATIRMLLLSAGWKEKEIARALSAQALDLPVPTPPDVGGAREAFLHLVAFASLYAAVIAALSLTFSYINLLIPDPAVTAFASDRRDLVRASIRWALSSLLVSVPVFLWLSTLLVREMRATPDRARSPVRRWLTYLTLFLASLALAGDVTVLVSGLLEGELSLRFLLKALAVAVVAGGGFAYYFQSLRLEPEAHAHTRLHRRAGIGVAAAFVLLAGVGLTIVGSPGAERQRRFDERRVEDLRTIYGEVLNQVVGADWRNPQVSPVLRGPLPPTLDAVASRAMRQRPRAVDPATGTPYGYEVTGASTFRLCATFDAVRDDSADLVWNHPAGAHCFDFDALSPVR